MPKYYTVRELAAMFSRRERTIRAWLREGDVFPHAFRVRDGYYVPASDVQRLIKGDKPK